MYLNQLSTRFTSASILVAALSSSTAVHAQDKDNLTTIDNKNTNGDFFHCDAENSNNDDIPTLIEKVYPSTVLVSTKPAISMPFNLDSSLEQPLNGQRPRGGGIGSGFVIDPKQGYMITNAHVVESPEGSTGALDYTVTFYDGEKDNYRGQEVPAELIGMDSSTGIDLALLQVNLTDVDGSLTCVQLGDSDNLRVGEELLAIGAPMGLGFTATFGRASHTARSRTSMTLDHEYIQHEASINRGNSGGPLFMSEGEDQGKVIGVNTLIMSPSGGSVGLAFAIPSNVVKETANRLIEDGKYIRGWLGVGIRSLTLQENEANNLLDKTGVYITGLAPDGPAMKSGIKPNDIITGISGEAIKNGTTDLMRTVRDIRPETIVDFTIMRNGETLNLKVEIGDRDISPDSEITAKPVDPFMNKPPEEFLAPDTDNDDANPDADTAPAQPDDLSIAPQPDSISPFMPSNPHQSMPKPPQLGH